jgi:Uncharacterized protein conserved in bacteria (DUF2169)
VTVVVKAGFAFVPDGTMRPIAAEPVRPELGEAAPYLGQADVVVTAGHAHAVPARAVAALSIRLALVRDWAVIDKKLLVYPRSRPDAGASPVRVQCLSLLGEGLDAGMVVNPADPAKRTGLGPLGAGSPERLAVLSDRGVPRMSGRCIEIEDLFPWSYFQVAPPDQRATHLRGDEWVILEGMHGERARWASRLPSAQAQAAVYPPGLSHGAAYPVEMLADQLMIDADRGTASMLWRGSFPVQSEAAATSMTLVAGVALPGRPVAWPGRDELLASPILRAYGLTTPPGARDDQDSMAETMVVAHPIDEHALEAYSALGDGDLNQTIERPPRGAAGLALTDEGVLGLSMLGDDEVLVLDLEPDDEIDDAATVALSAGDSAAMRSALGLPVANKRMLRPARLSGLPWMAEAEPAAAAVEEDDDAPELEAYTIDSLELTLSESLIAQGIGSLEELEALANGSALPGKPDGRDDAS